MFEIHGIELKLTDCALDEMVARAAKMETGARSLKRVIHATLGRYDRRLPEMAARGVKTLTVTAETVRGEKPAIRTTAHFSQRPGAVVTTPETRRSLRNLEKETQGGKRLVGVGESSDQPSTNQPPPLIISARNSKETGAINLGSCAPGFRPS